MMDLEYLLAYVKQCHEARDAAEILDVIRDIKELDNYYQLGNEIAICQFVGKVVDKHQKEADEHDKGLPPA